VNFLEEKLKQIDDEFNRLSIKFERKKFKLKTIRENFVNVTVQKKDMEEEITYLRT
jgi:archaellum component FlaC